jgi:hypothetical protein
MFEEIRECKLTTIKPEVNLQYKAQTSTAWPVVAFCVPSAKCAIKR